jgi:multidrug resistance efflux pump
MDLLLLLFYAGVCTAIFKIFKIPLNKYTVPTAVLGGIVFLGFLLFWMNFKHPYAKYAKELFASIPIVPAVSGIVTDVMVEPNTEVEAGAVLFQIDKKPYQLEIDRIEARLVDTRQAVKETSATLESAKADVEKAIADRDRSKDAYDRAFKAGVGAVPQDEIDNKRQAFLANEAELTAARADLEQIELSLAAQIGGVDTRILEIEAELDKANYDLERTTVRAPSKGMATQLALREGAMATSFPVRPSLVFVPTARRQIVASFWQNARRNVSEGREAEVILDAAPGHIFPGRITTVVPVIPEADIQAGGDLISGDVLKHHDRMLALIELEEDLNDFHLPVGVQGSAAVYSEQDALHSHPVRRILLRMMGWLNYLYPIKK